MSNIAGSVPSHATPQGVRRLWDRQLPHYPDTGRRMLYLALTVIATITVYYELYSSAGVGPKIIQHFGFTFTQFVFVSVIGNAFGAFAALAGGLADRWGRANLVVVGLLLASLLVEFGLPNASSKAEYTVFFTLVTVIEGVNLVATPALIRDFSPQVGRGLAMGFWTIGPVLGSLIVSEVASHTLASHPDWRFQFQIAGAVGLAVSAVALIGLRELSPGLRDQVMVSIHDRTLVETRAAGLDPEQALTGHWRQMLRPNIVGSALAIGVFLALYYVFVGFLVVYLATVFGYSTARANNLANWYWATFAVSVVVAGLISDRLLVRKPVMIAGAVIGIVGAARFAAAATSAHTGYHALQLDVMINAAGTGAAFVAWMAAFTETVEKYNPAATATGLAVFAWTLRIVVVVVFSVLTFIVPATTTLVEKGPRVQTIVARYPEQVKVLQTVAPPTLAALKVNPTNAAAQAQALSELSGVSPTDLGKVVALTKLQALGKASPSELAFLHANGPKVAAAGAQLKSVSMVPTADLAYLSANGPKVAKAAKDNPRQWQTWWWICVIAQALFIPVVFLMVGRWTPRGARADLIEHERLVDRELARLQVDEPATTATS